VLCYTSDPVEAPVDLVGPVSVVLHAASSAVDTDFVARLCDVSPDGRSLNVCEGLRRARYRHGLDREELLKPGTVEQYEISLGDTAWRVLPGHRLRLQITSSNFPNWDRNMNTGNALGSDAVGIVAAQEIHHGGARPSHLTVSVLSSPNDTATPEAS
jgi:putative CocE/NonD family hydrolase